MKRRIVAALMVAVLIGHSGFGLSDYSGISNAANLSQNDIEESDLDEFSETEQLNSDTDENETDTDVDIESVETEVSSYASDTSDSIDSIDSEVSGDDAGSDDNSEESITEDTEEVYEEADVTDIDGITYENTETENDAENDIDSDLENEADTSDDYDLDEDIDSESDAANSATESSSETEEDIANYSDSASSIDNSSDSISSASNSSSTDDASDVSSTGLSDNELELASLSTSGGEESEEFSYQVTVDGYVFDFAAEAGVVPDGMTVFITALDEDTADAAKESINETLPVTSTVKNGSYFDISFANDSSSTASDTDSETDGSINVSITVPDSVVADDNSSDYIEVIPYDLNSDYEEVNDYTYSSGVIKFDMTVDAESSTDIAVTTIMSIELSDIDSRVNDVYAQDLDVEALDNEVLNARASNLLTLENMKTSTSEIAADLKSAMKQRSGSITINYSLTGITASNLTDIMDDALDIAVQHTGAGDEGDYLRWSYSRYSEAYSYTTSGSALVGQMFYTFTYNSTLDQENTVTSSITSLSSELGLSGKSDAEKVYTVHKYITDNIKYDYAHLSDSTYMLKYSCYAAIVNKTSVCQGYALLFYRMMLANGIDARLIAGEANGGSHGWNIVKISGGYYNLDPTWDAGKETSDYDYFLKCNKNFKKHTRWSEYNTSSFNTSYPMSGQDYDISTLEEAEVDGVKLNKDSLTIKKGKSSKLKATVSPSNAGNTKVTWKSSNKKVATVTSGGKVKAKKAGTCIITVTTKDGGYTAKCYVTVYNKEVKVKKVSLNKKKATLDIGGQITLKAKIKPTGATNKKVTWKSSDKSVATVNSSGVVTAVGSGSCTITVKTKSGKKKAKCNITVN